MSHHSKKKSRVYASAEGYDIYAELYDESLGYLSSFEKDQLLPMFGDLNGKNVLDAGAGTGRIIRDLKNYGAHVTALDTSNEMLKICKKKFSDIETVLGDVENMPFEDDRFDLVIATFVVVHLKNLDKAFDEIYRVLKDGGSVIITNINQRKAPKLKLKNRAEIVIQSYYHRPQDVISGLEQAFFKIEKEKFIEEEGVWVNQIVKARKLT